MEQDMQQTITKYVKAEIDKLIHIKMELNIQIKQNNFKLAIKKFAKYIKLVTSKIDNSVKICKQKWQKIY